MKLFEKISLIMAGGGIIFAAIGLLISLLSQAVGMWVALISVSVGLLGAAGLMVSIVRSAFD